MTAEQLINEAVAEGKSLEEIQEILRAGINRDEITAGVMISTLAQTDEEIIGIVVNLFSQTMEMLGAQVNPEEMAAAYVKSIRLSQDAFIYDQLNPAVEGEVDGEEE